MISLAVFMNFVRRDEVWEQKVVSVATISIVVGQNHNSNDAGLPAERNAEPPAVSAVEVEKLVNVTLRLNLLQRGLSGRNHLLRRLAAFDFNDNPRVLVRGREHQIGVAVARLAVGEAVADRAFRTGHHGSEKAVVVVFGRRLGGGIPYGHVLLQKRQQGFADVFCVSGEKTLRERGSIVRPLPVVGRKVSLNFRCKGLTDLFVGNPHEKGLTFTGYPFYDGEVTREKQECPEVVRPVQSEITVGELLIDGEFDGAAVHQRLHFVGVGRGEELQKILNDVVAARVGPVISSGRPHGPSDPLR